MYSTQDNKTSLWARLTVYASSAALIVVTLCIAFYIADRVRLSLIARHVESRGWYLSYLERMGETIAVQRKRNTSSLPFSYDYRVYSAHKANSELDDSHLRSLRRFQTLSSIKIPGCLLNDNIIDAICENGQLKSLNLDRTNVTDEQLAKLIRHLPHLKQISLDDTNISESTVLKALHKGLVVRKGSWRGLGEPVGREPSLSGGTL